MFANGLLFKFLFTPNYSRSQLLRMDAFQADGRRFDVCLGLLTFVCALLAFGQVFRKKIISSKSTFGFSPL